MSKLNIEDRTIEFVQQGGMPPCYTVRLIEDTPLGGREIGEVRQKRESYPWAPKGYLTWYAYARFSGSGTGTTRIAQGYSTRKEATAELVRRDRALQAGER